MLYRTSVISVGFISNKKQQFVRVEMQTSIANYKGGKFLKKLWCCVGGSITRNCGAASVGVLQAFDNLV